MAGETWVPDQAALHSELLPAPRSDRTAMGTDASARNPQPRLRDLQRVLPICSAFPARGGTEKLGSLLRFGHRQFPRHQPRRFSGSQGVGVYIETTLNGVYSDITDGQGLLDRFKIDALWSLDPNRDFHIQLGLIEFQRTNERE